MPLPSDPRCVRALTEAGTIAKRMARDSIRDTRPSRSLIPNPPALDLNSLDIGQVALLALGRSRPAQRRF
ncbi:MAG: hypothetical protein ABSB74_10240 [Tepidisphaeraceae bacterium]